MSMMENAAIQEGEKLHIVIYLVSPCDGVEDPQHYVWYLGLPECNGV